ncbi:MAG: D-tyrosyl-tRNA(Tyr) deacylase [bacterium]|nr:D-tyrosyl-tRNA(Tyr) deacylase [bacterium]
MRAVVQRVLNASVEVDDAIVSSINKGLLVLIGFHHDDAYSGMDYIINKILGLRIFDDENGVMNVSVEDIEGEVLLVSQFTLYGDVRKGKRPSYTSAMPPDRASEFYDRFVEQFRSKYEKVGSGEFGAHMKVSLVNSGPVTILLESPSQGSHPSFS